MTNPPKVAPVKSLSLTVVVGLADALKPGNSKKVGYSEQELGTIETDYWHDASQTTV